MGEKRKKSQNIIWTDQGVGIQKLCEDISHEHSHVSRSRFQQLNVLELAAHLDKEEDGEKVNHNQTIQLSGKLNDIQISFSPH